MGWAPKGPFGTIVSAETLRRCDDCGHGIRTADADLLTRWLNEHSCDDPYTWTPDDDE